jgi:adenylate cyclase
MSERRVERRLAAIMAGDVVGYSRLMGADEQGTLGALKAIRRELGDPKIAEHRGRIVKTTGDGLLVEFASVVDAVRCAVEVQQGMAGRNADVPADQRIEFRFGIHQGDIIIDDGDIFGDGVNLAARLEGLAEPGGLCVSRVVRDEIRDKLDFAFDDMGEQSLKNIARPMRVFAVNIGAEASRPSAVGTGAIRPMAEPAPLALPDKPSLAVLPFQNMSGDPEQEYFADGMVEEITMAIARLPWLLRHRPQFRLQAADWHDLDRHDAGDHIRSRAVRHGIGTGEAGLRKPRKAGRPPSRNRIASRRSPCAPGVPRRLRRSRTGTGR